MSKVWFLVLLLLLQCCLLSFSWILHMSVEREVRNCFGLLVFYWLSLETWTEYDTASMIRPCAFSCSGVCMLYVVFFKTSLSPFCSFFPSYSDSFCLSLLFVPGSHCIWYVYYPNYFHPPLPHVISLGPLTCTDWHRMMNVLRLNLQSTDIALCLKWPRAVSAHRHTELLWQIGR